LLSFAGEAERAIEWGERGLRLSLFDPWSCSSWHAVFLGHFHRGCYDDAVNAARKSVKCNPGFSISHMSLAGTLAQLGGLDEAKAAAVRVVALQPGFRIGERCAALDPAPAIAAPWTEALPAAGLPE